MRPPLKITLGYLLVSAAWITASDSLLSVSFPEAFPVISLYKGWAFVLATAALLYVVLDREWQRRDVAEAQLRASTVYDPLTGLLNRTAFVESVERAVAAAARSESSVGLIFLDLDGFKEINDRHGHHIGDEFLAEVGRRLKETARSGDGVARFGGDEFLVLATGGRDGVERLAERLRQAMGTPFVVKGLDLRVTASIGVAMYPEHGQEGEDLIRAADFAMYRVKKHSKDAVMVASPL